MLDEMHLHGRREANGRRIGVARGFELVAFLHRLVQRSRGRQVIALCGGVALLHLRLRNEASEQSKAGGGRGVE